MALTEHYYTKFEFGKVYHVYNRVVKKKKLFKENRNYDFFMGRLEKYVIPYVDLYSYCLLDNHFHLLFEVKDLGTLKELPNIELPNVGLANIELPKVELPNLELANIELPNLVSAHAIVSSAFRKMFQSYALAFNKQENRIGTLFQEPFKRAHIDTEECLQQMIYYIHFNPQKHKLINDFREYLYSSFANYIRNDIGVPILEKLTGLFGSFKSCMEYHSIQQEAPKTRYSIE